MQRPDRRTVMIGMVAVAVAGTQSVLLRQGGGMNHASQSAEDGAKPVRYVFASDARVGEPGYAVMPG